MLSTLLTDAPEYVQSDLVHPVDRCHRFGERVARLPKGQVAVAARRHEHQWPALKSWPIEVCHRAIYVLQPRNLHSKDAQRDGESPTRGQHC